MLDYFESLSLLTLMEVVGPILLAAALIYGLFHARRRSQTAQADSATRDVYAGEERRRRTQELT